MKRTLIVIAAGLLGATAANAGGADACLNCHEPDELKGLSVEQITASLTNPDNKMHRRVKDLSAEEIQAIVDSLAE